MYRNQRPVTYGTTEEFKEYFNSFNPPLPGELVYDNDERRLVIGDGTTPYSLLLGINEKIIDKSIMQTIGVTSIDISSISDYEYVDEWSEADKDTSKIYYSKADFKYYYYRDNKWNSTYSPAEAGVKINAATITTAINTAAGESSVEINADKINFISQKFEIYPSDGYGNKTSDTPNFAVDIEGNVVANSITLGSNTKGLSKVAISGAYNDLSDKPKIPTSVSDLGLNPSTIIYKGDITQSEKTDSSGNTYKETIVPSSDGKKIKYATYDADEYIVFGTQNSNIAVDKEGLLEAHNAVIYGTIYATDGEFKGTIEAKNGIIKNGVKIGDDNDYALFSKFDIVTEYLTETGSLLSWKNNLSSGLYISDNSLRIGYGLQYTAGTEEPSIQFISLEDIKGGVFYGNWSQLNLTASYTTTSDKNKKNNISDLSSIYSEFFDNLKPVTYKYNDGTSDRLHTGFIAQDVKQALDTVNIDSKDFAGLVIINKDIPDKDPLWTLRYEEFIALNTNEIQKLKQRVKELEDKLKEIN